jgi:hypothetical protein
MLLTPQAIAQDKEELTTPMCGLVAITYVEVLCDCSDISRSKGFDIESEDCEGIRKFNLHLRLRIGWFIKQAKTL